MKYLNIIIVLIFVMASTIAIYAQDIIITVKAGKIEAKIVEIDSNVVKYRQYDFDTTVFSIKKSDIVSIAYQNGQVAVFGQLQEETKSEEQNGVDTINDNEVSDYADFKGLDDRAMMDFLKTNDSESYQIFYHGNMQRKNGLSVLIAGSAITGLGAFALLSRLLIPFGAGMASIFSPNGVPDWVNNLQWLTITGLSLVVTGLSLIVAGVVLRKQGGALKKQAKNNYERKFFKDHTTMLNFKVYPNGIGMSLNF